MKRHRLCLVVLLALILATGCSSRTSVAEPCLATCTVARENVDGAENAKVDDYVANLGRGVLVHLDTIDESVAKGGVVGGPGEGGPTFSGNKKDARIRSISGDALELSILDADTAAYLANSHLCRLEPTVSDR